MTDPQPRLRMFAGPNGSGKSTIKEVIPAEWLGVYINPDEIEKTIRETGGLPLAEFEVQTTGPVLRSFLETSVLSDFLRQQLLATRTSFTFETVMSSADKVAFFCQARAAGFRTYLYYVATEDPTINVERVRQRVASGGHDVSEDKIRSRYQRSLDLLLDAVECADRAYVFDNSGSDRLWVAEATDGTELEMKTDAMPAWFKTALWDRFGGIEEMAASPA
ncbi:zeta toxin family protein [Hydrogenophaga sp. R2]|uniref:zeta toxin family protein n=1 Tax=Hydrogenophaga sp. R2 TaxID=3132827 RepID=UPI003CF96A56